MSVSGGVQFVERGLTKTRAKAVLAVASCLDPDTVKAARRLIPAGEYTADITVDVRGSFKVVDVKGSRPTKVADLDHKALVYLATRRKDGEPIPPAALLSALSMEDAPAAEVDAYWAELEKLAKAKGRTKEKAGREATTRTLPDLSTVVR